MKLRRYCDYCKRELTEAKRGIKPYHAPIFYCDENHRILGWQNMDKAKRHRVSLAMHIPYQEKDGA